MIRVLTQGIAVVCVSLAGVATGAAQSVRFGVGGGLTAPIDDYKDVDKTGWHAVVRADVAIPLSPVGVRVDGLYSRTTHKDINSQPVDGNTKVIGGLASLVWKIPTAVPLVKPYVLAGGGICNVKQTFPSSPGSSEVSETKFTWGAGLGASIGVGPVHAFVEGRYLSVQLSGTPAKFVPVTAGVTFGSK